MSAEKTGQPASPTAGLQRTPCLVPPRYDIDAVLDVDLAAPHAAFNAMNALCEAIEKLPRGLHFRPESSLLTPEVVVRDLCNFDISMGNGFASCLSYGGGFACFFRALRALRIVHHQKGLALAEAVREAMAANGAREPSSFPDDHIYGTCDVDWDKELENVPDFDSRIKQSTGQLDDAWFDISHTYWDKHKVLAADDPPLHYSVCIYLNANREMLRRRKSISS
jgi:hypothetical protein